MDTPLSAIFAKFDGRVPYAQSIRNCYEQVRDR